MAKTNRSKTHKHAAEPRFDLAEARLQRQVARIFGGRRIDRMAWKTLARLYAAARPGSAVRKIINAEARRCGYTPSTILGLNAE